MIVRLEQPGDQDAIRAVHRAAFHRADQPAEPVEVELVDQLRNSDAWLGRLSFVAVVDDRIVGHVVCSRGAVDGHHALGLGPLGVLPECQRRGVGRALMHAVIGAAEALGEPLIVLLGHTDYYPAFGFVPARSLGIEPSDPTWRAAFQARPLTAYRPDMRGSFRYAEPFDHLS